MKAVLSIAGSDCSGGAGIQADLKTMLANGVYGMSAITALTAQNTTGVSSILTVPPEFLEAQLDAVFTDIFPDAVKVGMISSPDLVRVIADRLTFYHASNIVVDPVLVATSGSVLSEDSAVAAMMERLFPLAAALTPNIPEAETLSGMKITCRADMEAAAAALGQRFHCAVLCKGGHSIEDANDLLYEPSPGHFTWFEGSRIPNPNTHGTGCTLSSAIASNLAKGLSLPDSVAEAKQYLTRALQQMLNLGKGSGPIDHGYRLGAG